MIKITTITFDILATNLSVYVPNYFNDTTELFSNRYLAKFLNNLVKFLFLCNAVKYIN